MKILPERERGYFKFDAGKIGDFAVHEIDMSSEAGDVAKKVFGKGQKAYFAFGKNALYASYGPDGMKLLKEAIEAKPGPTAVYDNSSNGKKMVELVKRLMPAANGPNDLRLHRMGGDDGRVVQHDRQGGDKLRIRFSNNLGLAMYYFSRPNQPRHRCARRSRNSVEPRCVVHRSSPCMLRRILSFRDTPPLKTGGSGRWFWGRSIRDSARACARCAGDDPRAAEFDHTASLY